MAEKKHTYREIIKSLLFDRGGTSLMPLSSPAVQGRIYNAVDTVIRRAQIDLLNEIIPTIPYIVDQQKLEERRDKIKNQLAQKQ